MAKIKNFIQRAIERPGRLTAFVRRKFGKKGFTPKGTIKVSVLKKLAVSNKKRGGIDDAARLALRLRRMRKGR